MVPGVDVMMPLVTTTGLERDTGETGCAVVGDDLEVVGGAAHNGAEGDDGVASAGVGDGRGDDRNLAWAGDPDGVDGVVGEGTGKRGLRSAVCRRSR
jgi:hypothetical protein